MGKKPAKATDKAIKNLKPKSGEVKGGNVRSQAEKRLETQRKDLTRNWAG